MTSPVASNSFLPMLASCGLLDRTQIESVVREFSGSDRSARPDQVCDWLVQQKLVTTWQAEKLRQSRFRGFFLGPYKLLDRIARGAMSNIYAAQHRDSGEVHALKVLPPARTSEASYLPRFQREAAIMQRLNHPNIVRVFGAYSESDGQDLVYFMAMELLEGQDLAVVVQSNGPLPVPQALDCIRQAALGLQFAHEAGLVHRDIKPGNLFLGDDGIVRVLDLGLAHDFDGEENLTRDFNERVLGTADYLAPEQAADSHTVDPRADIYSLGCSLYFLLTGQPPFTEGTLVQRLIAHQKKAPRPLRDFRDDVPAEVETLLLAMMAKPRDDRPATAGIVAHELDLLLNPDRLTESLFEQPLATSVATAITDETDDVFRADAESVIREAEPVAAADDPFISFLERVTLECAAVNSQDPRRTRLLFTMKQLLESPSLDEGVTVMADEVTTQLSPAASHDQNGWYYWIMPAIAMSLLLALCVTSLSREDVEALWAMFK